jgi:hypothetical protein
MCSATKKEFSTDPETGVLMLKTKYSLFWKMASERRDEPKKNFQEYGDCSQNPNYIVCPYCLHKHEPYDLLHDNDCDLDEEAAKCTECDKDFVVSASFGYGYSADPVKCRQHDLVFESQYLYKGRTWRIMTCKNCTYSVFDVSPKGKTPRTLLPWLDEYNDPDFFDPDGVLKTGADLSEPSNTPILDFLEKGDGHFAKYWWPKLSIPKIRKQLGLAGEYGEIERR